jgi:hypothetical protein
MKPAPGILKRERKDASGDANISAPLVYTGSASAAEALEGVVDSGSCFDDVEVLQKRILSD